MSHPPVELGRDPGSELRVEDLWAAYGRQVVVRGVDLAVAPGERVALLGTNGSGKSTVLRCAMGLHPSRRGRILLDGAEARTKADWAARRRRVAWVPQRQDAGRFPLLVGELLASSGDEDGARAAAERLGVGALGRRPLSTLSGGQLQRAFLARAIGAATSGSIGALLADEPTAALDFDGRDHVVAELCGVATSVLVVTHDRAVADACDRRYEMAGGEVREIA